MRNLLMVPQQNQLKWAHCLADSGFCSIDNMTFIHKKLKKQFIFAMKTNRLVALSKEDKAHGRYTRIDSLEWSGKPVQGGRGFPVLFHRQVVTNKDDSTGILSLITNDLNLDTTGIETIYQKRGRKLTSSIKTSNPTVPWLNHLHEQ